MTDNTEKDASSRGVSLDEFEAGVRALAKLLDSGKCLLFLPRAHWLRIVTDEVEFIDAFKNELGQGEGAEKEAQARRVLKELEEYLGAFARVGSEKQTTRFLCDTRYGPTEAEEDEGAAAGQKELVGQKVAAVSKRFFDSAMADRLERLKTSGSPCLEELDVDLVSVRQDRLADVRTTRPFLRLRFRYSEGEASMLTMFPPWIRLPGGPVQHLELDCDETDIDLLVKRLLDAKQILLEALNEPKED